MRSGEQRECIVGGNGLCGYLWEQGLPVGVQKCLEGFHRRCIDYLSRQFIANENNTNAECVLATVGVTSLLVDLKA